MTDRNIFYVAGRSLQFFRIPLRLMNSSLTNTRDLVSVFFETLFILFILSTAVTSGDQEQIRRYHQEIAVKAAPVSRIEWQDSQANELDGEIDYPAFWSSNQPIVDLPALASSAYKSFFTIAFERSVFHIFGTASAP